MGGGYPVSYRTGSSRGSQPRYAPPARGKAPQSVRTPVPPLNTAATARFALGRLAGPIALGILVYDLYHWYQNPVAGILPPLWAFSPAGCSGTSGTPHTNTTNPVCGGSGQSNWPPHINTTAQQIFFSSPFTQHLVFPTVSNHGPINGFWIKTGPPAAPAVPRGRPPIMLPGRYYDVVTPMANPNVDGFSSDPRSAAPDPNQGLSYHEMAHRTANPYRSPREQSHRGYDMPPSVFLLPDAVVPSPVPYPVVWPYPWPFPEPLPLPLPVPGREPLPVDPVVPTPDPGVLPDPGPQPSPVPLPGTSPPIGTPVGLPVGIPGPSWEITPDRTAEIEPTGVHKPPPSGTKEVKAFYALNRRGPLGFVINQITEFRDNIRAIWKALPKDKQNWPRDMRPPDKRWLLKRQEPTIQSMVKDIWDNRNLYRDNAPRSNKPSDGRVLSNALDNVATEWVSDWFYGQLGQAQARANRRARAEFGYITRLTNVR